MNSAACLPLNCHRHFGASPKGLLLPGRSFPRQKPPKVGVIAPQLVPKGGNVGDTTTQIDHALSMGRVPILCKWDPSGILAHRINPMGMSEIWPQRPQFVEHVKAYRLREKVKLADIAKSLGLEESTLKDYLYREDTRASLEVLQKASKLFRVSVTEFIDDPGAPIAGQDMSQDSEEDRFFAKMLIKGVRPRDLTDEQKQFIIEDTFRIVARIRAMAAPGMVGARENPPGSQPDLHSDIPSPGPRRTPRTKR